VTVTGAQAGKVRTTRARLLFVHAHPDDETLTTGITMAAYSARGHEVHVLTCTLGEEGEVIPAELAHLAANRDDTLGPARREELRKAMAVLGVEHCVLGEDPARGIASRYRDSGMADSASARHSHAFARADLGEAAAMVAAHITALRPDVVVTYDRQGGYGHPDHVQTHRVTMSALSGLAAESALPSPAEAERMAVPAAYCILTPRSWASEDRSWLQENVASGGSGASGCSRSSGTVVLPHDAPYPPSVVPDDVVTHVMDEPTMVKTQSRALAEHRTQVTVHDGYYVLSNHIAARLCGREGFARFDPVTGQLVPAAPGAPRHTGLLSELEDHE
jgi:N-acetyl-1-D-myo-inositol-2-amino-2-deoxy-alpha-D-glucopyranoside deacetylase